MSNVIITPDPAAVFNVGRVTSYADAVAGGYQGTREEWERDLAALGTTAAEVEANRQAVADDKAAVEGDVTTVGEYKEVASAAAAAALQSAESAHTDALASTAAKEAAQTAQGIAEEARTDAVSAKTAAESAQSEADTSAEAAAGSALAAQNAAETATANAGAASDSATAAAASATAAAESARTLTIDTTLTQAGQAADAKRVGDEVADLKSALDYTSANASYRVNVTWETGAVNGSTGAEEVNANYSRTTEYISTNDADFVFANGGNFTLILFDLEDGNYVRKASKYVNAASSPWAIDKRYSYFRISGGMKIANHPENYYLIYKYTKTQTDLDDFETHFIGKYAENAYITDGILISWKQSASRTVLKMPHDKNIQLEGFQTAAEGIPTNNIFSAASASDIVTVSGDEISGNNFAIIYNITTGEISITAASTYKAENTSERVFFKVAYNSYISGMLVDYVIRKTYENMQARLSTVEGAVSHGTILPDYWYTYLDTKIADVQSKDMIIGNHGDSFVFVTDLHYETNDGNSAGAIKYILDHSSVSKVIIGGDICNGDTASKQGCINQIVACRNDFREIDPYYLRGNHDNNTEIQNPAPEKAITDSELYGIIIKPIENKIIGDKTFHYYFDNNAEKVRYICLDTGHPDTNVISDNQITWMQERITELSAEWTVIVLTHQYYATVGTMDGNGEKILAGLNAIYDTASATIAGVICGHSHADYMDTTTKGFPIICTTCDVRAGQNSSVPLTRTAGTYTEQAFDVFHIDTAARKIHATRIGAGSDRETTY